MRFIQRSSPWGNVFIVMKNLPFVSLVLVLLGSTLLFGCASKPSDRISANRATYDAWPADVQSKVAAGEIAVGFTEAQVRMAMGDPSRVLTRTGKDGTQTVWDYAESKPGFSIGLGVGGGGGSTRVGGGVGVGTGGRRELVSRVVFSEGVVDSIETSGTQ